MDKIKEITIGVLSSLKQYLPGNILKENGIDILKLDASIGKGTVRCVCFDDGLVAIEFDIVLKKDRTICFDASQNDMIHFFYCLEGNCFHQFEGHNRIIKLEQMQTAVVSSGTDMLSKLLVRKGHKLIFNAIYINKDVYLKKFHQNQVQTDVRLEELLKSFESKRGYFYTGSYNITIGELVKKLEEAKYASSLSALLHFEGICHLILAKQIEQFNAQEDDSELPTTLLKREIRAIEKVCDLIVEHPEYEHTIKSLCYESTLSPAKLQAGFKFLHNRTVADFVRHIRLEKAEELMRTTDLNISEIVYSVGLTSRSYFCKIFKERHKCSPKQYHMKLHKARQPKR